MKSSNHWKFWLVLFPIIGTCAALGNFQGPGGMRGFFAVWYGISVLPSQIPGLEWWIDAADSSSITLESGTNLVSQWNDKSGNAKHLTQATSANRPSLVSSVQNGNSIIRFTSTRFLTVTNSTSLFNFMHQSNVTYFIVAQYGTNANPGVRMDVVGNNNGDAAVGFAFSYDDQFAGRNNNYAPSVTFGFYQYVYINSSNNLTPPQQFHIIHSISQPTNSVASNRIETVVNTNAPYKSNTSTGNVSANNAGGNLTVGRAPDGQFPFTGDICEIIIYSGILSSTEIDLVRRYLNNKWSVY